MKGQQITIVVGSPAGGGYDAYGRLVGRHLGAMLPGNPSTIVQNMAGAGSLIAANWLANSAPKDGTAIAILPNATLFEPLFGNGAAHFDPRAITWLASLNGYTPLATIWAQAPAKTTSDLFTHELLIGASGATSDESVIPKLLNSLIHTRFNVINGYPGTAGIAVAMERGEVQGLVGDGLDSIKATKPDWLRENKVRLLMQVTAARDRELPDVPTALEFAPAENKDVLALLVSRWLYGRLFVAPPGVPPAAAAALREGFKKMLDDPEFQRDAQKSNMAIEYASAEEMTATLGKVFASPQPVIDRATKELRRLDPN